MRRASGARLAASLAAVAAAAACGALPEAPSPATLLLLSDPRPLPLGAVSGERGAAAVRVGGLTATGTVYCWGDNRVGQLGQPAAGEFSAIPVKVAGQP